MNRPTGRTLLAGVFALALAARLAVVLRHGGLNGTYGYDPGVYFAGADAFVHGRLARTVRTDALDAAGAVSAPGAE